MDDELEDVFNKEEMDAIITQEGLQSITELFEFFSEALEIAIEWIQHYQPELSEDEIRGVISEQVTCTSMDQIVSKLSALNEIQDNL